VPVSGSGATGRRNGNGSLPPPSLVLARCTVTASPPTTPDGAIGDTS
jgi:hypothetical protein